MEEDNDRLISELGDKASALQQVRHEITLIWITCLLNPCQAAISINTSVNDDLDLLQRMVTPHLLLFECPLPLALALFA